jgi:hypothetical protein
VFISYSQLWEARILCKSLGVLSALLLAEKGNYFVASVRGFMPKISDLRKEIEAALHPAGFSKVGWESIRYAAMLPKGTHSCDYIQAQRLWIAAAIRRSKAQNQPVTRREVNIKLAECGGDLSKAVPGFVPMAPGHESLPQSALGRQLPDLVEQITGYRPDDNRLRAWCAKLGFIYSRNAIYSGAQVDELIQLWRSMRIAERQRAKTQAYRNFHHSSAA